MELPHSCGPADVVETGKGAISHHCNICFSQLARKSLIFPPFLCNFASVTKGHRVQYDVDDYPAHPIISSCHRHYDEAASTTLCKGLLVFTLLLESQWISSSGVPGL